MTDPALLAALEAIRAAHQRVKQAYNRLCIVVTHRGWYGSVATASELRDAADALLLAVTELEFNRPVGGTMHEPPEPKE